MVVPISVRDVMSTPAVTVSPQVTVREAADHLRANDVGSLLVEEDGKPIGILTDTDFLDMIIEDEAPTDCQVSTCMSAPVVTIDADAPLIAAARRLRDHGIKRLAVVEDGNLVGVVTTTDISYYVPAVSVGAGVRRAGGDPAADRPETAYEDDSWDFTYHDETGDGIGVGDEARFTKELTDADVRQFAELSGDTNRLHLEDDFAENSRFGGRIVHGTLVLGVISAALARIPGLTVYLSQDVSFLAPVPIGATVTAICRVVERIDGDRFRLHTEAATADGTTVVDGEATVLIDPLPAVEGSATAAG